MTASGHDDEKSWRKTPSTNSDREALNRMAKAEGNPITRTEVVSHSEFWETTVDELMSFFREALCAVTPVLKRARIHIGVVGGTDSWDEITEALFREIVWGAISNSLTFDEMEKAKFQVYEMAYRDYASLSYIRVIPKRVDSQDIERVFHALVVNDRLQFDQVRCRSVDIAGQVISDNEQIFPFGEVLFEFAFRNADGTLRNASTLKVVL